MLVSIAGIAVWMVIFIIVMERTNQLGLTLISGSVYVFAAALAYLGIHVSSVAAPRHLSPSHTRAKDLLLAPGGLRMARVRETRGGGASCAHPLK